MKRPECGGFSVFPRRNGGRFTSTVSTYRGTFAATQNILWCDWKTTFGGIGKAPFTGADQSC